MPLEIDHLPKLSGIYEIFNLKNGKVYVGSSVNIRSRAWTHRDDLKRGAHGNRHLQRAWDLYGPSVFTVSVLELVEDQSRLGVEEGKWILRLNSWDFEVGYNLVRPSSVAEMERWICTEQTREAIRLASIEVNQRPGFLEKRGLAISAGLSTLESKERRSQIFKEVMNRPEVKSKLSGKQKKNQEDPGYRKMMSEAMAVANRRPEVIKNRSEGQKKKAPVPEQIRQKMTEGLKKKYQDPEYVARRREGVERRRALRQLAKENEST